MFENVMALLSWLETVACIGDRTIHDLLLNTSRRLSRLKKLFSPYRNETNTSPYRQVQCGSTLTEQTVWCGWLVPI
jgi:hypothetical protein